MREPAIVRMLPDGRRLHLHDGPIDLIVEACGARAEILESYAAAAKRFETILDELCSELPVLRSAATVNGVWPRGIVAQRMADAVAPFATEHFVTPMAAVAGSVAEEILSAMKAAANLSRAYVNNGGDIALHLDAGESFTIGMIERPERPSLFGAIRLQASHAIRGIATSGWRGRSFSLGIADAVTVLAERAAMADAAATIIANAVDLPDHPAIVRMRACEIAPENDLGSRLVTRSVGELTSREIARALQSGATTAVQLRVRGLISAAALKLEGQMRVVPKAWPLMTPPNAPRAGMFGSVLHA
jgi:ApbE superfamily uncharacterized protein (UPF0280 family)